MKLTYLGTAAAEGFPALFCNCDACKRARAQGGENIRTRSQILIGDDLLIDFPPDSYMHALRSGYDFSAIKYILFTHSHPDHCMPIDLIYHGAVYGHEMTNEKIDIIGNKTVISATEKLIKPELSDAVKKTLKFKTIEPYQTFTLGNYEITALPARHIQDEDCLVYLIRDGKTTCFIFNDSGVLDESVYEFMKKRNVKLDLVSFDCTYGYTRRGASRHMGLLDNVDETQRMKEKGLLLPTAKLVATHFSHNGGLTYCEFKEKAAAHGFITAHDDLSLAV